MATLNFLTGNAEKLAEAQTLFSPLGWEIQSFEIDGEVPDVIEPQSDNLTNVALAKIAQGVELLASQGRLEESLLVEDSGLFIYALPEFPGVYSAQVLKSIGCEGILRLLDSERSAHFLTVAVLWTGEVVEVFASVAPQPPEPIFTFLSHPVDHSYQIPSSFFGQLGKHQSDCSPVGTRGQA